LHEEDFASAIEQILKDPSITGCVNVGNPTFNQISEIVATWQGSLITDPIDFESNQNNIGFFPDIVKLTRAGWEPSISLEVGIQRMRKEFNEGTHAR
jgi:nucleoside-diphosphate-sugar epimerase